MTTDRTALESARDALPPLPEPEIQQADYGDGGWNECLNVASAKSDGYETQVAFTADQLRDYAAQAVTAALSSPPVLPAAFVTEIAEGRTLFMPGPWLDTRGMVKLYAAPQEAAPALDDARDVAYPYLIALDKSELEALADYHDHQQDQADYTGLECSGNRDRAAVIRAAMQQEPRS